MSWGMGLRRGFCSAVFKLPPSGGLVTEITFIGAGGNEVVVVVVVVDVFFTTVHVLLVPPTFATVTLDIEPPPLLAVTVGAVLFVSVMISTIPPSLVVSYVTIYKKYKQLTL